MILILATLLAAACLGPISDLPNEDARPVEDVGGGRVVGDMGQDPGEFEGTEGGEGPDAPASPEPGAGGNADEETNDAGQGTVDDDTDAGVDDSGTDAVDGAVDEQDSGD